MPPVAGSPSILPSTEIDCVSFLKILRVVMCEK
jgi:hypothetical protein